MICHHNNRSIRANPLMFCALKRTVCIFKSVSRLSNYTFNGRITVVMRGQLPAGHLSSIFSLPKVIWSINLQYHRAACIHHWAWGGYAVSCDCSCCPWRLRLKLDFYYWSTCQLINLSFCQWNFKTVSNACYNFPHSDKMQSDCLTVKVSRIFGLLCQIKASNPHMWRWNRWMFGIFSG